MKRKHRNEETSYTYYALDPESGEERKYVLTPGEAEVTEEWILLLKELDHEEALRERYDNENCDFRDRNYKKETYRGNERATDPLDQLAYEQFIKGDPDINPMIDKVRNLIWSNLTDDQIDLVYQIYGARKQGTEIASEEGVRQQAIDGRNRRIKDKIRKLIEE